MTLKRISSYISRIAAFSVALLLLVSALPVSAQKKTATNQTKNKTVTNQAKKKLSAKAVAEKDTVALFRGVAVSADLIGAAQLALSDYGQYEAALRINLRDKYFPVFELGYGKADADDPSTKLSYKTSAPYARIGLDFNIAKNKHDDYRIYGGFRYAFSYYKFDVASEGLKDPVWGDNADFDLRDIKANYHWLEGVFGVDAKIAGPFRLGWSVRYRRHLSGDNGTVGNTWYVPGYGKQGGSRLGGTFNVIFEL